MDVENESALLQSMTPVSGSTTGVCDRYDFHNVWQESIDDFVTERSYKNLANAAPVGCPQPRRLSNRLNGSTRRRSPACGRGFIACAQPLVYFLKFSSRLRMIPD